MELGVREVARLFRVSENTVYAWISKDGIPAQKIRNNYHFNRAELLEWATSRGLACPAELFKPLQNEYHLPSLREALDRGGVYHCVPGADKEAVLKSIVDRLHLPPRVNREFLYSALLARESMGTTAIGKGVAIPHVRNPIILQIEQPQVALCFLQHTIDYGALDGQKVGTLFFIASNNVREHLHLLARLSFVLQKDAMQNALQKQASAEDLALLLETIESAMGIAAP